ncbi:hypothetical protein BGZ65_010255, partial [Modicella reniformis]
MIGSCEVDLKETLFSNESGEHEGWFQLTYDGKDSGQVNLRLRLCEPSEQEDAPEVGPIRGDHSVKAKSDKMLDKLAIHTSTTSTPVTPSNPTFRPASAHGFPNNDKEELGDDDLQRTPTNLLGRRRSLTDLMVQRPTTNLEGPIQQRMGSKSLEEVRDLVMTSAMTRSTDDLHRGASSMSSPKQTYISQDSDGNINQLNLLVAPFDPNWLEPTPQLIKRALSRRLYYEDLMVQQRSNPRDLFPRPQSQQSSYPNYPNDFGMADGWQPYQNVHGSEPPQQQQQGSNSAFISPMPFPQPYPPQSLPGMPQPPRKQPHPTISPQQQPWSSVPPSKGEIPFPTPFQQHRQPSRSRMDAA